MWSGQQSDRMSGGAPQEEGRINGSDTAVQKAKKNAQRKKDHKSMADLQQIEDLFKSAMIPCRSLSSSIMSAEPLVYLAQYVMIQLSVYFNKM